jgi:hypothetical protein
MPWRPHGRASFSPRDSRPAAICDKCGFMFNLDDLANEVEYAGRRIVKSGFMVCEKCDDELNPQVIPRSLPPDPVPIRNPRPQNADMGPEPPVESVRDILGL